MNGATERETGKGRGRLDVWGRFILSITLIVMLFVLGVFIGVFLRNRDLIQNSIETRARSHFHNILLARRWNAAYGGVFVEKKEGVVSNPYLENPDIVANDGRTFTKKNPALMTREISEIADKDGMFTFHITSLKPLNPGNAPDAFEQKALAAFEAGTREVFETAEEDGKASFRYMAPLFTEDSCLACHAKQGYKGGEVRGGVSVRFDVSDVRRSMAVSAAVIVALCVVTAGLMLGLLYFFIVNLMRRLKQAQAKVEEMAVTDALTGLRNRRHLFERLNVEWERVRRYGGSLGCVMIDVDHFKKVNDVHGHLTGDRVLKGVAEVLRENSRITDLAARFGGEEFLILLPGTDLDGAREAAEKLRLAIAGKDFPDEAGQPLKITASFGCASLERAADKPLPAADDLVRAADVSLYRAKAEGRNQVQCGECVCAGESGG